MFLLYSAVQPLVCDVKCMIFYERWTPLVALASFTSFYYSTVNRYFFNGLRWFRGIKTLASTLVILNNCLVGSTFTACNILCKHLVSFIVTARKRSHYYPAHFVITAHTSCTGKNTIQIQVFSSDNICDIMRLILPHNQHKVFQP